MPSCPWIGVAGLVTLVGAGLGCGASEASPPREPSPPPIASHAVASPPVSMAAPLPPLTPCEQAGRDVRASLKPLFDEWRRFAGDYDARATSRDLCWPDAQGAWSVAFSAVVVDPSILIRTPMQQETSPDAHGQIAVVRLDREGKRVVSAPRAFGTLSYLTGQTFDWDGDGVPELVFPLAEAYGAAPLAIHTARGGAVVPYPPAAGIAIREVRDLDGDGRPDLFYTAPFDGALTVSESSDIANYGSTQDGGFWLVAHALPDGTFTRDDAVTQAYAQKTCEGVEASFEPHHFEQDALILANVVRCAKLRGVAQAKIDKILERACNPRARKGCFAENDKMMRAWASATAPFTLRSPP